MRVAREDRQVVQEPVIQEMKRGSVRGVCMWRACAAAVASDDDQSK